MQADDGSKLLNTRYSWGTGTKLAVLRIQMIISSSVIFFAIIQATNVYLLQVTQANPLTYSLLCSLVILILLSALTIAWAMHTSRRLNFTPSPEIATNTKSSQILHFVSLVNFVIYTVLIVLFQVAKQDLFNSAKATSESVNMSYSTSFARSSEWILVLGYIIIALLILTSITLEMMTDSRHSANLMIFLFSLILLMLSFAISIFIQQLISAYAFPSHPHFELPTSSLTALKSLLFCSLLLLSLGMFVNTQRKEISYLISGSLFLLLLLLLTPIAGHLFRAYSRSLVHYETYCPEHLGNIHASYLESNGCAQKYIYKNDSSEDCASTSQSTFESCFETIPAIQKHNADTKKEFITTVWETSLYESALTIPRLAGLRDSCCGVMINIYSRHILLVASLILMYIIFAFIIACFFFKNSAHAYQDNEPLLSIATKQNFIIIFVLILCIGGTHQILSTHSTDILRRDFIVVINNNNNNNNNNNSNDSNSIISTHKISPKLFSASQQTTEQLVTAKPSMIHSTINQSNLRISNETIDPFQSKVIITHKKLSKSLDFSQHNNDSLRNHHNSSVSRLGKDSNQLLIAIDSRESSHITLRKHTMEVSIRDIVTSQPQSGFNIDLYENYYGNQSDETMICDASRNAKRIFSGVSSDEGILLLDFLYTAVPKTHYTIEVNDPTNIYSTNCRTFTIHEKRTQLDIGVSGHLKEHQIRFVLEWGSESVSTTRTTGSLDLDLYLSANSSIEGETWMCYASYFSSTCAGATYHRDSHGNGNNRTYSSEAITIEELGEVKYLVFFKLPVISRIGIDNSVIADLKPLVKVFRYGEKKPTQTSIFDAAVGRGTVEGYESNYRFANLAWCVNGINSELVRSAKGYSYPVAWQAVDPEIAQIQDLPLASVSCT